MQTTEYDCDDHFLRRVAHGRLIVALQDLTLTPGLVITRQKARRQFHRERIQVSSAVENEAAASGVRNLAGSTSLDT
jgi:hypothetical protein